MKSSPPFTLNQFKKKRPKFQQKQKLWDTFKKKTPLKPKIRIYLTKVRGTKIINSDKGRWFGTIPVWKEHQTAADAEKTLIFRWAVIKTRTRTSIYVTIHWILIGL